MNCPEVRDRLPALAANDLPTSEADAIARHLAGCPNCRREADELRAVLRVLSELPASPPPAVDLPGLYRTADLAQRRRLRRWRRAALVTACAAAVVFAAAALRLEVRLGPGQVVLSWGPPPPTEDDGVRGRAGDGVNGNGPVTPSPARPVTPSSSAADPLTEERLRLVQDLVRALAADVEARDDRQRDELLRLRARVDAVQSQARQWFAAAENDVKALYTAFGTRDLGGDR